MEEKLIMQYEVEFEGSHHFKNLYKTIYLFLQDNDFHDTQDGDDKYEILYFEKVAQNGNRDMHIWWRTFYPTIPNPHFFRFRLEIDFQVLYLRDIQEMKKDRKVKTHFADSIVRVRAYLDVDINNLLEKFPLKYVKNRYLYYWHEPRTKHAKDEVKFWARKLADVIKQYLELNQTGEEPAIFHYPTKGV